MTFVWYFWVNPVLWILEWFPSLNAQEDTKNGRKHFRFSLTTKQTYRNEIDELISPFILYIVINVFTGGPLENQLVEGQSSLKELDMKKELNRYENNYI